MYKLVALFALIAVSAAAPKPQLLTYSAPSVVAPVVSVAHVPPAVSTYSSYSTNVVHGVPVFRTAPLVHTVPVVHAAPVVQTVPLTYSAPTVFV